MDNYIPGSSVPAWRGWRWSRRDNSVRISTLHALVNANTCHMDGTFAITPRLFYQIVTLHVFVLGVMLPLVFDLLSNKEGKTYIRFLSLVKEKSASLGFSISPQRIMQDFEKRSHECLHIRVSMRDSQGVLLLLCSVSVKETSKYGALRQLQREC